MLPSNRTYAFWLALLRIAVGGSWLLHGIPKFTTAMFMPPTGFMGKMIAENVANSHGRYHDFLANVVTPNIGLFAELVRLGEVVAGALLLLGLFSRLGGLLGMFLMANYMLTQGEMWSLQGWATLDGAMFILCAINVVLPTGRSLGLDWFLARPRRVAAPMVATAATQPISAVQAEFVEEPPLDGPTAPH